MENLNMINDFGIQIGQCRLHIYAKKTQDYYKELPFIKDNCQCEDCAYFQDVIINQDIRFFRILKKIGIDLSRQPNINPDGVCSLGEIDKFKRSYMGYYLVFGKLGKSQKSTLATDENSRKSVHFFENEEDCFTDFGIIQETSDQIRFDFFIKCEKIGIV